MKAGFAACGIIPFNPERVLSKLPPEDNARQGVQNQLNQQLLDQLKLVRYGEPEKSKRARKANCLPPGTAYTVSATLLSPQEPVAGPSGDVRGCGRGAVVGRGGGGRGANKRGISANFYGESSDSDEGRDSEEDEDSKEDEDSEEEEEEEEEEGEEEEGEKEQEGEKEMDAEMEVFEVGDFVAAVYEGEWLLAQVDIDQDRASYTHVNLAYMERVGRNHFKWPKQDDCLLTLKEDILFKCAAPVMVGSSIRACHVGLSASQAAQADAALDLVVYLQSVLFPFFFSCPFFSHIFLSQNFDSYIQITAQK